MASPPFNHDETNPLNTALVSTYPANERTFRENVNDWMNFEHGDGSGRHKIPTGDDTARDAISDWEKGSLWMSSQSSPTVLQMNVGTKASPNWIAVTTQAQIFPSGTKMLFQQTAAPTGWTKETTHNNKALRLQTGTVTTGGADNFTAVFGPGTPRATDAHILSVAQIPAHAHSFTHPANDTAGNLKRGDTPEGGGIDPKTTGFTGEDGGHSHNIGTIDLKFVDVIIAAMD